MTSFISTTIASPAYTRFPTEVAHHSHRDQAARFPGCGRYDILQGSQSIRGDVPATLFAYGSVDDVANYCEKLINMGMKGGFMLSSGCEIPLNAKTENIKAMMDAVK